MRKRKSQMEMMGLVIIVILVTVALLFTIQFIFLKETSSAKKTYVHTQLAANTLNALMETTAVGCKNQKIQQLLQDCAGYRYIGGLIECENGLKSCEFVENAIDYIMEETLEEWNKDYAFNADLAEIELSIGDCTGERQRGTVFIPIPEIGETMTISLDICG